MIDSPLTDALINQMKPIGFPKPVKKVKAVRNFKDYGYNSTIKKTPKLLKKVGHRKAVKSKRVLMIPLPKLVKKADDVFATFIKRRDGRCVTPDPKCKSYLQASHLIKRGRKLIRWEESNVHTQCQHHNYNHDQGFHPSPEILTNYVINKYGVEEYNRLFKLSKVDAPSSWVRAKAMEVIKKYESDSPKD